MRWLCLFALVAAASAQIPSLGWCPDFQPMANFNMNRFLGSWYEAERYFTVTELGSRCVTTKYERTPEGRILVSNEIVNSLTGMKRVMDGSLQVIGPEGEGRIIIKYSSLPVPYDNEFTILDTDYENYAVMWSCSGIGPVHTQNAWVLTRERLATPAVMQSAYGVLDRYKISRAFFVKTNQADCNVLPTPVNPVEAKNAVEVEKPEVKQYVVPELKHAVPEVKHAVPVDKVVEPVQPVEVPVPEVKANVHVPQERVANAVPEEEAKPMPIPEMIMSESKDKLEEPMKPEMKPEAPEMSEAKEPEKKEEKPAL